MSEPMHTEQIKRYNAYAMVRENGRPYVAMDTDMHGEWFRYDDHAALLAAKTREAETLGAEIVEKVDRAKEYARLDAYRHIDTCMTAIGLERVEVVSNGVAFTFYHPPIDHVHLNDGTVRLGKWYENPQNARTNKSIEVPIGHRAVVFPIESQPPTPSTGEQP